jgi:hypothetical protein
MKLWCLLLVYFHRCHFLGRGNSWQACTICIFLLNFFHFLHSLISLLTKGQFSPHNLLWTCGRNCFDAMTHNSLPIIKKNLRCSSLVMESLLFYCNYYFSANCFWLNSRRWRLWEIPDIKVEPLNERYKVINLYQQFTNNWNLPSPNTKKIGHLRYKDRINCSEYNLKARDELPKSMDKHKPLSSRNDV